MGRSESSSMPARIDQIMNALGTIGALNMFYLGPIEGFLLSIILFFSPLCPFLFLYFFWVYLDRHTPYQEGRRLSWIRKLPMYQRFRNYFPQKVVKTAELPTTDNYMLCVFPHGVLSTAAFSQFTSDDSGFGKLFPHLSISCHTLNSNFWYPFSREYVLAIGCCAVSKEALLYHLDKPKRGHAAVLVVGGSAEAMISLPGTHRVILKNRKGFVKLAITTGTSLVPIYSFGETDLYQQYIFPKDSIVYKIQEAIRKFTGVAIVFINGSGIFQPYFGLLPRARPVHMIVGKPIPVMKNENPSREDVDNLHNTFMKELTNLFEEHKHKYIADANTTFLSIE